MSESQGTIVMQFRWDRAPPLCTTVFLKTHNTTHQETFFFSYDMTWDELVESNRGQIAGLADDRADILMIENIIDTPNPKAAMYAVDEYLDETSKVRLPVMLSVKIVDNSGRTLSGQTMEAFTT